MPADFGDCAFIPIKRYLAGWGEGGVKYLPYRNRVLSLIPRTWVFVIFVFILFTKHSSTHW